MLPVLKAVLQSGRDGKKMSTIFLFKGRLVLNSLDGIVIPFLFVNWDVAPKPTTLHCIICGMSLLHTCGFRVVVFKVIHI